MSRIRNESWANSSHVPLRRANVAMPSSSTKGVGTFGICALVHAHVLQLPAFPGCAGFQGPVTV
jgi:hypothetical protein